MRVSDRTPLWRLIVRQSLWSKRGITKTGMLWLPLSVLFSVQQKINIENEWAVCLWLFVASVCRTQATILANNLADRKEDHAAGKLHWITLLNPVAGAAVVIGLLTLGAAVFFFAHERIVLAIYIAASLLGMSYSLRPIRFKDRGLAGLIVYGMYAVLAYVVVPWAWLGNGLSVVTLLSAAVFLDRWVNLHFHQIIDFDVDAKSACRTYVVRIGLERARRELRWVAFAASASMIVVLASLLSQTTRSAIGITAVLAVAAGMYASIARRTENSSCLIREVPSHYLGLTLALFRILPILLFIRLAVASSTMWIPTVVAAVTLMLESYLSFKYKYP